MKFLILFVTTTLVLAAKRPVPTRIRDCYKHRDTYNFCNHGDFSVKRKRRPFETFGWCCPFGSTDKNCQSNGDIECTKTQSKPLYMTYWPG